MPRARHLTIQDALQFVSLSDAQISPDGRAVAYVSGEPARENTKFERSSVWVVERDGGAARPFTNGPRSDQHPRWSPDGASLAFLSDRLQDGKLEIYLLEKSGGEAVKLTDLPGKLDISRSKDMLQWSPDGAALAFLMQDPETDADKKRHLESGGALEFEKEHKFTRLWVLDLASRKLRQVTTQPAQIWEFEWSPGGDEFALIVSDFPYEWAWYQASLARIPAAGGDLTTIYRPPKRQIALPRWSPDSKQIGFLSSIWSDRGVIQGDIFVVDAEGGKPRDVTTGYDGSTGWFEWIKGGRSLLIAGYRQGEACFATLDLATDKRKTVWQEPVMLAENFWPRFSLASNGRDFSAILSAPHQPREVWHGHLSGPRATLTCLTNSVPELKQFKLGAQELVAWSARDGRAIRGVLLLPPGYKKGSRQPTIVNPHGGPTSISPNGFLSAHLWGQLLVAQGYVVFMPNFRGSTGFGLDFAESNLGDMGGADFEDIESGVDWLIEQGIADPDRLGIGGWSYGGFMTCWTITQTRRYKAAVMGAGISNWSSFHGNSHLCAWDAVHYDCDPYDSGGVYSKFSAMNYVRNVNTPTLILHGEKDRDVPPEQSYQFFRALMDHRVETELVVYPREGHAIRERAHWVDLRRRIIAWYDAHLK